MSMKPSSTWFPMPLHSLLLWVLWLMLNTFSVGHAVLGAILAFVIPLLAARLSEPQPGISKPMTAIRYVFRVTGDIIVSNLIVAKQVLGATSKLKPGFVAYPLQLKQELPITILASTISLTPGTVSVEFSEDYQWLYIHALNLDDADEVIDSIRTRYEQPLQEIFGC